MHNLISNGIKYTAEGRIMVTARLENSMVRISVADTGVGISPGDIGRLFDKFHQLGNRRDGRPLGTGLGLAISKEIVTYLGGRIWCESELGRGSKFIFTIPVWNELRSSPPTEPALGRDGERST
jgi:signal transduction histidine kinase